MYGYFVDMEEWGNCGKNCPVASDVNPWSTDETLKVIHDNKNQREIMIGIKLLGIMSSSLFLLGLMVTELGMFGNEK